MLDSFLNQVKVEQHPQSEPMKRVLTPPPKLPSTSCEGRKLRETLCWWIANNKVCPDGDRCNFKHMVTEEKVQTVSGTGVSWPSPATEQNVSGTDTIMTTARLTPGASVKLVTSGARATGKQSVGVPDEKQVATFFAQFVLSLRCADS